jgi:hypothetical protein
MENARPPRAFSFARFLPAIAFLSEVDTGSREENASNQNHRAPLLIPSEAERL